MQCGVAAEYNSHLKVMDMKTLYKNFLLLVSAGMLAVNAGAQTTDTTKTLFLASTSTVHPYARPQWSVAEAEKWFDEIGEIKGLNHPQTPCDAVSQDEALNLAHLCGFNSVRWFFGGNTSSFISSVQNAAEMADKYGMTVAPVFGFARIPSSESDSLALEQEVRQIARTFRNDKRVILWDVWNEPEIDSDNTPRIMNIIKLMAQWLREEGCTQAITSSIIWDSGIGASGGSHASERYAAEREMDIHNFHDYSAADGFGTNIWALVSRINKYMGERPMICTEALTRVNGSGVAMSLRQFAKYKIGFYTWGLYSCDSNWDVKWGRSTYNAFEPMFHNLFYAGGEPLDAREEEYIKMFKYTTDEIYPGMEETDRWTLRRAWKWMADSEIKGVDAGSLSDAITFLNNLSESDGYNCVKVTLSYTDYNSQGGDNYRSSIKTLASLAESKGVKILPVLFTSSDLSQTCAVLKSYTYDIVNSFYNDRRFEGWCLFEQTSSSVPSNFESLITELFAYTHYAFPNQPMFASPLVTASQNVDTAATDVANLLWKLSDVTAFSVSGSADAANTLADNLYKQYSRPLFFMNASSIDSGFASRHINFMTSSKLDASVVSAFAFTPLTTTVPGDTLQMPSWKAWAQMNRGPVKGMYYSSVANALEGLATLATKKTYNSIAVSLDFDTYNRKHDDFIESFNTLLDSAGNNGITVLPVMLNDRYAARNKARLLAYITEMVGTYNNDPRILAWELYDRPCRSTSVSSTFMTGLITEIFSAARSVSPNRPVFVTPYVICKDFADDFDYLNNLAHFGGHGGWRDLQFGNAGVSLVYLCWKLSDICAISSSQDAPELGTTNSVAHRFGRPVICTDWINANSTTVDATLSVFSDHHEPWYSETEIDDSKVSSFKYRTVITDH